MNDQEYQEAERQHFERMGDDYSEIEKCPDCGSAQMGHFPNHETKELVIICKECGLTEIEKI